MRRSFELDLILGVANLAAENENAEVPLWSERSAVWDDVAHAYAPNPPQPEGAVPIFVDATQQDGPYVLLSDYTVDDDPSLSESTIGIQVTIRSQDRTEIKGITSDLFALLHGRWGGMLGPVRLVSAQRASGTNVGQDSNLRMGRTENYYLRVHRPSTNRQ